MNKVSVCVLSYEGVGILPACLDAIFKQRGQFSLEVLVTDNGSSDGTSDLVRKHYPCVRLITHAYNQSFTRCYNRMFCEATGDYLAIVNNDVELQGDDFIGRALELFQSEPRTVMIAPQSLVAESVKLENICKRERNFGYVLRSETFLRYFSPRAVKQESADQTVRQDAEVLQDSCVFLRRAGLDGHGRLYDESMQFYYTEDYICVRLRRLGHRLLYAPELRVRHLFSHGTRRSSFIRMRWIWCRDAIAYVHSFYGAPAAWLLFAPLAVATFAVRMLYWVLSGRLHHRPHTA